MPFIHMPRIKNMKAKTMNVFLILFLIMGQNNFIFAQSLQYGLPGIRNFTHSEYGGGNQNWSFTESPNGLVYFANNSGLLEFDGAHWALYTSIPSINRCVLAVADRIYVSAFSEFGYYQANERGLMKYHSLTPLVKGMNEDLGEIWRIHKTDFGIIFSASKALYIYKDDKISVIRPHSVFHYANYVNGIYWIADEEQGLMEYRAGKVRKAPGGDFFKDHTISSIMPLNDNDVLIGTVKNGVFIYDGYKITPWIGKINESLKKQQIYYAIRLKNNYLAFGTIQNGLYVTDLQGNQVFAINKARGLQNNTVLGIGQDSKGNIWLCLDNGISVIEFDTPVSYLDNYFDIGTGYVAARYGENVFLGTNQGLYFASWTDFINSSKSKNIFRLVEGTGGQVWALSVIDNTLFCGHHDGIFQIRGTTASKISNVNGAWNFLYLKHKGLILVGNYRGLLFLEKNGNNWQERNRLVGFAESSRFVETDQQGYIWVSQPLKGIYRVKPDSSLKTIEACKLFGAKDGLPSDKTNFLFSIGDEIVIGSANGVYKFNYIKNRFEKAPKFEPYFKENQQVEYLYQDSLKNLWYIADRKLGVLNYQPDGTYKNTTAPFDKVSGMLLPSFTHVSELNHNDVLVGIEDGFVHYISNFNKAYSVPRSVYISKLQSRDTSEGIYRFNSYDENQKVIPAFKYRNNTISISFSANNFESSGKEFQYKLVGFDDEWSEWTSYRYKEYTNLPAGDYTFMIRVRNNDRVAPSSLSYKFTILPPWYRTWYAWLFYILSLFAILILIQRYIVFRFEKSRLAEIQLRKEKDLIAEKELEHLRNEKLNIEVIHKEKELANSTMQLIKKNEILNKLKTDILNSVSSQDETVSKMNIKNLIKRIDKEIDNEKQWQVFNMHVEQVYDGLFKKLKDQYPDLTPRELSLCAYLRMNISSKEIASLMNISYRGVEISRYRIRKKLKLSHDANLTEFMLKL